jgi:cell filamentation protein
LVASQVGHPLDLERLDPDEMLAAMIASFDGEEGMLTDIIEKLIH